MIEILEYIVSESDHGIRLDKYLVTKLESHTRSFIQKLIQDSNISVNAKTVKANYKIRKDDIITITIPKPQDISIESEKIPIDIIYEDEDIVIVNKAQGMVVHPAPGNYNGTLVNALLYHCKDGLSGINGEIRPGIVHRIDKDTSGILVIAKNDKTHQKLSEMLKAHSILRQYQAIVFGNFKDEEGTIDAPIGRHSIDRKKMAITSKNSRHAITHYKILEQFRGFTHIEATLETGRTHQIRVHMKHIGHPLLGDPVYGPQKQPYAIEGQFLHAKKLGFIHPSTGQYMEFDSPLPLKFKQMIDKLRNL